MSTRATKYPEPAMGERGRLRRMQLGYSLRSLAAMIGVTPAHMRDLERDGATTIRSVRRWAVALQMDPGELAFGATKPVPLRNGRDDFRSSPDCVDRSRGHEAHDDRH